MGAVAVAVISSRFTGCRSRPRGSTALIGAVGAVDDVQLSMVKIDPGIQHSHININAQVIAAVNINVPVIVSENPLHARGYRLLIQPDRLVSLNISHTRIMPQSIQPPGWNVPGHSLQRIFIGKGHGEPVVRRYIRNSGINVNSILKDHNIMVLQAFLRFPRLCHSRAGKQKSQHQNYRQQSGPFLSSIHKWILLWLHA